MRAAESYVRGATGQPLIEATIGACFDRVARQFAEREALVVRHQNVRWTYAELARKVDQLAVGLIRLGLAPGERIGIWSQNNAEWVLTQFATAKAGLILVNINPAYRRAELEYALKLVGCKALILSPRFKSSDYLAMLREAAPELAPGAPGALTSAALPELKRVIRLGAEKTPGMLNFDALLIPPSDRELALLNQRAASLKTGEPVNIQFTSGTTGAPKGATLTHRNILNNGFFCGEAMRFTERDRVCIPVPLYHCFGMVIGNLAAVTHGAVMVFPDESFDAKSVLDTVQAERCTALHGVPTMFIAVLEHPEFVGYELGSLRTGCIGGAPCPADVMKRLIERMNLREITIAYGMTETSPVSFQTSPDDAFEQRVSSVGRVHPHVEVKIVDGDGRIAPRGTAGEILTRGYSVMPGYWNDPKRTAEAIDAEGWMHTGDLGTLEADGYCSIVGRSKDLVIRGGENIYPREVEEFLYTHPKIVDVQCVGVPDPRFGEELCACIVLKAGMTAEAEEIRAYCRERIAHYKIPRHVRFMDSFPMTVTGKIQKFALREMLVRELGSAA